jgi:ABC-type antimicrobial peptide transport system permease subunit
LERRGELALLLAVGFRRRGLRQVILTEHGALLCAGLGLGILSGAIAVLPSLLSSVNRLPYGSLALTFLVLLLNGAAWTWLATSFALRGNLLQALRNE